MIAPAPDFGNVFTAFPPYFCLWLRNSRLGLRRGMQKLP
ncbi:hypothetical protein COO91_10724 (plasmid) [Nostoc flagelliforme CCNUN1]|uniref:Uncharacterized protein n=1 Tax=Nostoc flagelliforme CCNUN1 TaxID=2038116 RepID=A0A2K8TBN8_9NOSO|nr:hypothetical protein COO91_10724 [Nostoc flagelliforme CCNUN1]